jgi:CP family cyanate transporter-like MFS transporter
MGAGAPARSRASGQCYKDLMTDHDGGAPGRVAPAAGVARWVLPLGVVLVAVNLRPALASVGPVLTDLRHDLHLSSAAGSMLTTVPLLCFGLLAPVAPLLRRRYGVVRVLTVVLAIVAVGLALRVVLGPAGLFLLTVPVAGAIAIANVLVPALIKQDPAGRVGVLVGVYTMTLSGTAAIAAGISAPLDHGLGWGWRGALAVWAAPALIALLGWLVSPSIPPDPPDPPPPAVLPDTPAPAGPDNRESLLRSPLAWAVTAFMGLQSLSFYAILTWLPSIYTDHGYAPESAGLVLSLTSAIQVPVALVVPTLAVRARDQRWYALASCLLPAVALAGILVAPTAGAYLWIVLLGIGQGAAFALALTLMVVRSRSSATAARLSAMAQTAGYLIAAGGPLLVGAVRDASGWNLALGLLLLLLVPQCVAGILASRARYVPEPAAPVGSA